MFPFFKKKPKTWIDQSVIDYLMGIHPLFVIYYSIRLYWYRHCFEFIHFIIYFPFFCIFDFLLPDTLLEFDFRFCVGFFIPTVFMLSHLCFFVKYAYALFYEKCQI